MVAGDSHDARLFGPDRLVFATDHPIWDPNRMLDTIAEMSLPERGVKEIETDNARRLFEVRR